MVKLGYVLSLLLAAGIAVYLLTIRDQAERNPRMWGLLVVPALLMFFVMIRHIRRRLTKLVILNDRLRYESGLFSQDDAYDRAGQSAGCPRGSDPGPADAENRRLVPRDGGRDQSHRHALH